MHRFVRPECILGRKRVGSLANLATLADVARFPLFLLPRVQRPPSIHHTVARYTLADLGLPNDTGADFAGNVIAVRIDGQLLGEDVGEHGVQARGEPLYRLFLEFGHAVWPKALLELRQEVIELIFVVRPEEVLHHPFVTANGSLGILVRECAGKMEVPRPNLRGGVERLGVEDTCHGWDSL